MVAGAAALALTGIVLLGAACVGLLAGGGAATLPRGGAIAAPGVKLRAEVAQLLAERYYRRVDRARLRDVRSRDLGRALDDPYTAVLSPGALAVRNRGNAGEYAGIGIHAVRSTAGLRIDAVTPHGPAALAGLRTGSLVTAVDGRPVAGLRPDAVGRRLRGRPGSRVRVTVRRRDQLVETVLARRVLPATVVRSRMAIVQGARIGVIGLTQFSEGAGRRVRAAARSLSARGARALVLDLRSNPGGLVREAVAVAGVFLPRGSVVYRLEGLHLRPSARRTDADPVTTRRALTVLVDGQSASSAEIVAGALRDHHRAVLVGRRTFGKGVLQDTVPLAAGGALKLTIASYRTSAGDTIQHRGISPDVVARDDRPPPADRVLDRALRLVAARR